MFFKVITLRFDSITGYFDDTPVREFIKDKEIISLHDNFFVKDEIPYLVIVITFYLKTVNNVAAEAKKEMQTENEWRKLLSDEDIPVFNTLRSWRSERCKKDGIAPYIICTNKQLAMIVKARPQSLNDLSQTEGFGKARLEKYGKDILGILHIEPEKTMMESNDDKK